MTEAETADVVIVGAGAAGLMTSISCARHAGVGDAPRRLRVVCLDGARSIGAKILVSGGARCNVTNVVVTERDFWGGPSRVVRDVLRAFPAARAATFFNELGVALHEEEHGKLFPNSNRARTVLDALLGECARLGVEVRAGHRVTGVRRAERGFALDTSQGEWRSRALVLATGGRSLPKSGSDGVGYGFARALGHGYVETTPALVPLILDDGDLRRLSGVAHPAAVTLRVDGEKPIRLTGSLLWTHFGASGPVILDASRHWLRARTEQRSAEIAINVCPTHTFESLESWWIEMARERPRASVVTVLGTILPASIAEAWLARTGIDAAQTMAQVSKNARRAVIRALLETRLDVRDSRGYTYAEVTAGGVPLTEIDPATMASRVCPGLYLVGEILDVDGRIGGFNFQWSWSTGWIAGKAIGSGRSEVPRTRPTDL